LLFAGAFVAFAMAASADTKTLARAGSWEMFGGTTTNGRGVCGISAEVKNRYFSLKFFAGNSTFIVQLGTPAWKIANGEKVGRTLRSDNNSPWQATGTTFTSGDGDAGPQYTVKNEELDVFAREFRTSSLLKLQFDSGRFPPWTMGLEDTMVVEAAFQTCIRGPK
jgi:hypothetical protein